MPGANTFPLYDSLYGGHLCEQLEEWRTEGLTLREMMDAIAEEHGHCPGRSTLGRWMAGECS